MVTSIFCTPTITVGGNLAKTFILPLPHGVRKNGCLGKSAVALLDQAVLLAQKRVRQCPGTDVRVVCCASESARIQGKVDAESMAAYVRKHCVQTCVLRYPGQHSVKTEIDDFIKYALAHEDKKIRLIVVCSPEQVVWIQDHIGARHDYLPENTLRFLPVSDAKPSMLGHVTMKIKCWCLRLQKFWKRRRK